MQQRQQTGGRGKAYLFLGISLVAAVLAAVMVMQLLKQMQRRVEQASAPRETVEVVVASRTLYMGLPIQEGDVVVSRLQPEMVPADRYFYRVDQLVGMTPKERILASEIVRIERLARREEGVGLNAIITPGRRAVSIAVKAEDAVAGFIKPLNYVDVIVVIKPDSNKEIGARAVSKTLLQGIKVLAVGDSLGGLEGDESDPVQSKAAKGQAPKKKKSSSKNKGVVKGKRTVTLEVTLEEAEELALASAKGDLTLALRADIDITQVETHGATADTVIGFRADEEEKVTTVAAKRRTPKAAPKVEGPKAEVVSGGSTKVVEFGEEGRTEQNIKKKK